MLNLDPALPVSRPRTTIPVHASQLVGVPDVTAIPGLTEVLEFVGLSADEVQLTAGMGGVTFGIQKTYSISLPSPFQGPSEFRLDLMLHPTTAAVSLGGTFSSAVDIPIFTQPLAFSVTAYVSAGAGNGLSVGLFGQVSLPRPLNCPSLAVCPFLRFAYPSLCFSCPFLCFLILCACVFACP